MKIIDIVQNTPSWINWRRGGIGGSDIAAIMGISPFKSAKEVFEDKLGLRVNYISPAMQRGHQYEKQALRHVLEEQIEECLSICCQREDYSFMRASLDGYIPRLNRIIEIKVPLPHNFESFRNGIPEHYQMQVQWQLFVSGSNECWFVVYSPENKEYICHVFCRDSKMIEKLKEAAIEFWRHVQEGIYPESNILQLDDYEAFLLANKYIEVDSQIKILSKLKEEYKNKIIDLGDDGDFRVGRLTFSRTQSRSSYDIEAMKKDGIDIEKYKKTSDGIGFYTVRIEK